ncbi:hypothetical protein [Phyllobacterium zundukense]|uniref:Uncharacterized protein n=1 Tax=Phyllobacterium zundukense TaxID=1867719 RepID=A0ACD4CYX1_9HYPH|nr:hypothetical protein [Phyllobacterium zundukense]UXN58727.1 hypothetical protein N8E88_12230 [Phyllobacterium zundukense]
MLWPYPNGDYPEGYFLAHGEEPVPVGRGHLKPSAFARRHGAAILHYRHKMAFYVDNALFPDGTRGRATSAGFHYWRRPIRDVQHAWDTYDTYGAHTMLIPVVWRWGRLDISDEDIAFLDQPEQPTVDLNSRTGAMDTDLYGDAEIKKIVDTAAGAAALFSLLVTRDWVRESDGAFLDHTHDDGASIVRDIRKFGETYGDVNSLFLDGDDFKQACIAIEKHLHRLGWHRVGP